MEWQQHKKRARQRCLARPLRQGIFYSRPKRKGIVHYLSGMIVQRHFKDAVAHFFRIVGIVGQGLCIGQHDVDFIKFPKILQKTCWLSDPEKCPICSFPVGRFPVRMTLLIMFCVCSGLGH